MSLKRQRVDDQGTSGEEKLLHPDSAEQPSKDEDVGSAKKARLQHEAYEKSNEDRLAPKAENEKSNGQELEKPLSAKEDEEAVEDQEDESPQSKFGTKITDLNDDVLLEILKFVSNIDLLNLSEAHPRFVGKFIHNQMTLNATYFIMSFQESRGRPVSGWRSTHAIRPDRSV